MMEIRNNMRTENKWTGTFSSKKYNYFGIRFVTGIVDVTLPTNLTLADTTAKLTYTGVYRRSVTMHLVFKYAHPTLVGTITDSKQIIAFTPTSISKTTIAGTYLSKNPDDFGTFSLTLLE